MTKFWVGSTLRHTITFYETDGTTPVDPTTVKLRVKAPYPSTTETILQYGVDAQIVRSGVGVYYIDVTYHLPGRHRRRWEASGNVDVIYEEWTKIEPTAFKYNQEATANALVIGSPVLQSPTLTEN